MVTQSGSSDLLVTHEDDGVMLDGAKISGGANFDFNFTLSIAQDSGTGLWSADGTFGFTDRNFNAAVAGNFTSTGMMIYPGEVLWIIGDLSTKAASESLLQNGGAFWEFLGNSSIGSDRLGYPVDGLDGEASKITVSNPNAYDEGTAWVLKFGVGTSSLDTLFASNFSKDSGEVKGVITPEPATMSLLAIGGLAVLKRRKRQMQ
jgi:hypothetical protein